MQEEKQIFPAYPLTNSTKFLPRLLCNFTTPSKRGCCRAGCSFCDKNVTFDGNFPFFGKFLLFTFNIRSFVHELFTKPWYTFTICYYDDGDTAPF